jgi:hypothetical protein
MLKRSKAWFNDRSKAAKFWIVLGAAFIGLTAIGVAATPSQQPNNSESVETPVVKNEPQTEVKTETRTEPIPFTTSTVDDPNLAQGTVKTTVEGVNGVKTLVTEVTYVDGKETSRVVKPEVITTQPVNKVVVRGTYVAPAPPKQNSSGVVKLSVNGICHAPGTTYYNQTKNYTGYPSLQACLDAGGRMPKR